MTQLLSVLNTADAKLVRAWDSFSKDFMTLKIARLAGSAQSLTAVLDERVQSAKNTTAEQILSNLREEIARIVELTDIKSAQNPSGKCECHYAYWQLSIWLARRGFARPALTLLSQSAREYVVYFIQYHSPVLVSKTEQIFGDRRHFMTNSFYAAFAQKSPNYSELVTRIYAAILKYDKEKGTTNRLITASEEVVTNFIERTGADFNKIAEEICELVDGGNQELCEYRLQHKLEKLLDFIFDQKIDPAEAKILREKIFALPHERIFDHKLDVRKLLYAQIQSVVIKLNLSANKYFNNYGFPDDDLRVFIRDVDALLDRTAQVDLGSAASDAAILTATMRLQLQFKEVIRSNNALLLKLVKGQSAKTN